MPKSEIQEMYEVAREHNTAHAQVSTRAERNARWFAILAAILAIFSGVAWTKLGGSIVAAHTAELVAALSAFAAAVVSAVVAAMHWSEEVTSHTQAAGRWGVVRGDIEFARLVGHVPPNMTDEELKKLRADTDAARKDEPNLTPAELEEAKSWLLHSGEEVYVEDLPDLVGGKI